MPPLPIVITGLVPVIHAFFCLDAAAWVAGTSPAMTIHGRLDYLKGTAVDQPRHQAVDLLR